MLSIGQKLKKEIIGQAPTELLENLGAGISIVDRRMRICWVNKDLADWFGPLKKIKGKFCYNVYQHRKRTCPNCPTAKVFQTNRRHSAYQSGFNQKGERRYYHLIVSPIHNGNGKASYAMELTYDLTNEIEKKKRKRELLKRMERFCGKILNANHHLKQEVCKIKEKNSKTFNLNKQLARKYHEIKKGFKISHQALKQIQLVDKKIVSSVDLKTVLDSIVKLAADLTHADSAALWIANHETESLFIIASTGLSKEFIEKTTIRFNEGVSGTAFVTGKPVLSNNSQQDARCSQSLKEKLKAEGILSGMAVPAMLKGQPVGSVTLYFKQPREFIEQEIELLTTFADQTAMAIHEARLYKEVHVNYFNALHTLSKAMEAKDPYTKGHSDRVTELAIKIARRIKMADTDVELLAFAGKVHDVGKIGISDTILNKPGKLTPAEFDFIKTHPQKGVEMLTPLRFLERALPFVLHHHERFDGNGYPHGLKKNQIPLAARILACADSYDAMTSDRPYRFRQLSVAEAIEELRSNSSGQFDPTIVDAFIPILSSNS